jgi:hypothetical protein
MTTQKSEVHTAMARKQRLTEVDIYVNVPRMTYKANTMLLSAFAAATAAAVVLMHVSDV